MRNPNSIGKLISLSKDLMTSSDKVYRSVIGREAIDDLKKCGVVRNKQSAGLVKSRWGDKVFWSQGENGKYHVVQKGGFIIETTLEIAKKRVVKITDITAIFIKNSKGEIENILSSLLKK